MLDPSLSADVVIAQLELRPHPEGGYYRETFRDTEPLGARAASTAIYFLLKAGQISRWHRVDAVEIWHYYAGAPLLLETASDAGPAVGVTLTSELQNGARPQAIVPRYAWQRARSLGAWTLVGCTVAPGFEFSNFELAPDGFDP